jgi:hypothetical protein
VALPLLKTSAARLGFAGALLALTIAAALVRRPGESTSTKVEVPRHHPAQVVSLKRVVATAPSRERDEPAVRRAPEVREWVQSVQRPAELARFNAWAARYLAEPTARRGAGMESEGASLAAARRPVMQHLIATDPERALLLAVNPSVRDQLPEPVRDQLEAEVAGKGLYGVITICHHVSPPEDADPAAQAPHPVWEHEIEREVVIDGVAYKASVYGTRTSRLTEENASLYGVALDGVMAVHEDDVVVSSTGNGLVARYNGGATPFANPEELQQWLAEVQAREAAELELPIAASGEVFDPGAPPTGIVPPNDVPYKQYTGSYAQQKGPKTVLFVYVKPSDGTIPPVKTLDQLNTELNSTSQWFYNASYKQTWFGPKVVNADLVNEFIVPRLAVTPVLNLPKTCAEYTASFGTLYYDTLKAVRDQGGQWNGGTLDPGYFDRVIANGIPKLINSTGLAYAPGKFAWVGASLSGGVANHELVHNWGTIHSNTWEVPAGTPPRSASGHASGGNPFHPMEGFGPGIDSTYAVQLGLLDPSAGESLTITTSGTYRLFNCWDVYSKNPVSKLRALTIPMSGANPISLAFYINGGTDGKTGTFDWSRNAVTMTSKLNYLDTSLLDTFPGSRLQNDFYDAGTKIGQTYSEGPSVNGTHPYGGFHVTPIARGSVVNDGHTHEYIDLVINYQNAISGNQPPTASFGQAIYQTAIGAPVALQVTAADPDSDTLAFDWNYGDEGYNIVNTANQTHSWVSAGLYQIRCTVSDMKGGTATALAWVNVGTVPYQPAVRPATAPGLSYRYYEGSWDNLPNFASLLPVKSGTVSTFSIAPRQVNDNFAFVYEGFITAPIQDIYTFNLLSDDGARLYIDNQLVIDSDGVKSSAVEKSGNIGLLAGKHAIRVEYFHKTGTETFEVSWSTLGVPKAPIAAASLGQADWGSNLAPTVSITAPVGGSQFVVGGDILLQANAADADGIAKVQFFSGAALVGENTSPPYSVSWPKVSTGAKTVVALAYDSTGRWNVSAPVAFSVVSPPPTNVISVNFYRSGNEASAFLFWNDMAGAIYQTPFWNNFAGTNVTNATLTSLTDQTGTPTHATVSAQFQNDNGQVLTNGDSSDANGRMMRSGVWTRDAGLPRAITFSNIPFLQYDVYLYFDTVETGSYDAAVAEYRIGTQSRFGKNSLAANDGIGDYPNYDTWIGFKEATAASASAPNSELLGNYLVFRNQTAASFLLEVMATSRAVNGIQLVEVPATLPTVRIFPPSGGWAVAEGGLPITYTVRLSKAPSAPVTVTLSPDAQLSTGQASLVFTPEDWNQARTVSLSAADDAAVEGPHSGILSHSVSAAGGYTGVTVAPITVTVGDNDQPSVSVAASGSLKEGVAAAAAFAFARSNAASLASPLTVGFSLAGTAAPADFDLSGASVSFDAGTATGSVVIPAGQAQVSLSVAVVDDALPEFTESCSATVTANPAYAADTGGPATLNIGDNDTVDYLTESFNDGANGSRVFDLNNKSITFTPAGGGGYTASVAAITAFPSGVTFSTFNESAMTYGSGAYGGWEYTLPASFTFHGVAYTKVYVNTMGVVSFGTSVMNNANLTLMFNANPKIAAFWWLVGLNPTTAGTIQYGRVNTAGQQRTVFFYNGVRVNGTSVNVSAQVELYDTGVIRISWLNSSLPNNYMALVGLSSGVAATMPSSPYTTAATPRPFYMSDLSSYASGANTPPVIASEAPLIGTVGSLYSTLVAATDPDLNTVLTLTAPTKPAWLALTPDGNGAATLSGTPPASGTFAVVLQVSDGSATAQQAFNIVVLPSGGNTAPVFTSPPGLAAFIGSPYSCPVAATDADGHSLAFSAPVLPPWLSLLDNGNGTASLNGTPPVGTLTAAVTLAVTDGLVSTSHSFILQIQQPPAITLDRPAQGWVEMTSSSNDLHLESLVDAFGAGSLALQWSKVSGTGNAVFSDSLSASSRVHFDAPGHYVLQLLASSSFGTADVPVHVFVATAPSTLLSNGLQIHYRFNEGSGTTATDASGNNRNATLTGANLAGVGYEGSSYLSAGGTVTYAETAYACPAQVTVSAWVNPDFIPVSKDRQFFNFQNGTTDRVRMYLANGTRRFAFVSNFSGGGKWSVNEDLPASQWTHVAVTYDGSGLANDPAVYFNGRSVSVTRVSAPTGTAQPSNALRIGATASPTTGNTWQGRIDEVRIYNRIVPALDIPVLMAVGPINQAPNVAAGDPQSASSANAALALAGSVTDDGLPLLPGMIDLTWSQESGPSGGSFGTTDDANTSFQPGPTDGTYILCLTADDGAARTSSTVEISVETGTGGGGTSFADWVADAAFNLPSDQRGFLDDWDKDGTVNLVEFAFGLNPAVAGTAGLPIAGVVPVGDEAYLQLTYRQRKGGTGTVGVDYLVDGVRYTVQAGDTPAAPDWSTLDGAGAAWVEPVGPAVDNGDDTETVTVRLKSPVATQQKKFLRLRLSVQ